MMHGGTFTPGQAQYADVNGDGKYYLLFQGNDNKEFLSVSSGSSFGGPSLVADFSAFGPSSPEPCTSEQLSQFHRPTQIAA